MNHLILLRHGKSDWKYDVNDFNRPLKRRGKDAAFRVGKWLAEHNYQPDLILSSPAERAYKTAKLCVSGMGMDEQKIETNRRLYLANVDDIVKVLENHCYEASTVMVVGHNPGLDDMVHYLSDTTVFPDEDGKLMSTAAIAIFHLPSTQPLQNPQQAKLLLRKRPQQLI